MKVAAQQQLLHFFYDFWLPPEGSGPEFSMVFTDPNALSTLSKKVRFSVHFWSLLGGQSGLFSASEALSSALAAMEQANVILSSAKEPCGPETPISGILAPGRQDDLNS